MRRVKTDQMGVKSTQNPFVCFRMQVNALSIIAHLFIIISKQYAHNYSTTPSVTRFATNYGLILYQQNGLGRKCNQKEELPFYSL